MMRVYAALPCYFAAYAVIVAASLVTLHDEFTPIRVTLMAFAVMPRDTRHTLFASAMMFLRARHECAGDIVLRHAYACRVLCFDADFAAAVTPLMFTLLIFSTRRLLDADARFSADACQDIFAPAASACLFDAHCRFVYLL